CEIKAKILQTPSGIIAVTRLGAITIGNLLPLAIIVIKNITHHSMSRNIGNRTTNRLKLTRLIVVITYLLLIGIGNTTDTTPRIIIPLRLKPIRSFAGYCHSGHLLYQLALIAIHKTLNAHCIALLNNTT